METKHKLWIQTGYKVFKNKSEQTKTKCNKNTDTQIVWRHSVNIWATKLQASKVEKSTEAMTWTKLNWIVSTTVYRPQKLLTARLVITKKYKGFECLFPFQHFLLSLFASFYPLLSVYFSLPLSLCLTLPTQLPEVNVMLLIKPPEESPSAPHFDWAGQKKMKAVRTEEEKCC